MIHQFIYSYLQDGAVIEDRNGLRGPRTWAETAPPLQRAGAAVGQSLVRPCAVCSGRVWPSSPKHGVRRCSERLRLRGLTGGPVRARISFGAEAAHACRGSLVPRAPRLPRPADNAAAPDQQKGGLPANGTTGPTPGSLSSMGLGGRAPWLPGELRCTGWALGLSACGRGFDPR